jgi:hypothetical protein
LACSASGLKAPPLVIYKGKSVWDEWVAEEKDSFPGTSYAATKKEWIESVVFQNYLERTLIPNFPKERPMFLIYDGHSTHVTVEVIEIALRNQITIIKLPPHTTHLFKVFKPLKDRWDGELVKWQRQHSGRKIPKKKNIFILSWK